MLSIADLETVYAVSKHSSFAAVARALNVSQPAVSQRINALENRLHIRLVERTGRTGCSLRRTEAVWRREQGKYSETLKLQLRKFPNRGERYSGTCR